MRMSRSILLSLLITLTAPTLDAYPSRDAQANQEHSRSMTPVELLSLLAGNSTNGYIDLLVKERGIAFVPDDALIGILRASGVQKFLLARLQSMAPPGPPAYDPDEATLDPLARCAELSLKGHYAEAEPFCRKPVTEDPQNPLFHLVMSNLLLYREKGDEATISARRAVELAPDLACAHVGLGRVLAAKGDYKGASAEFHEALRLDPNEIDALIGQGITAERSSHDSKNAIDFYRQALRIQPNSSRAHLNLGLALRAQEDLDGAIAELNQAALLDTEGVEPLLYLGMVKHDKTDYNGALAAYREGLKIQPDNALLHMEVGWTLAAKGDVEAAISELKEALRLDPKLASAHFLLGNAFLSLGKYASAAGELRQAIQLDPSSNDVPKARNLLYIALIEGGDPELLGSLSGNTYKNDHFGFTYEIPREWIALPSDALVKYREHDLSSDLAKYGAQGMQSFKSGTLIQEHTLYVVVALPPDVKKRSSEAHAPTIVLAVDEGNDFQRGCVQGVSLPEGGTPLDRYFRYSAVADPLQSPDHRMIRDPTPITLGGRKFIRADFRVKLKGETIWEAWFVTFTRDYFVQLELAAESKDELERLVQEATSFTFLKEAE